LEKRSLRGKRGGKPQAIPGTASVTKILCYQNVDLVIKMLKRPKSHEKVRSTGRSGKGNPRSRERKKKQVGEKTKGPRGKVKEGGLEGIMQKNQVKAGFPARPGTEPH